MCRFNYQMVLYNKKRFSGFLKSHLIHSVCLCWHIIYIYIEWRINTLNLNGTEFLFSFTCLVYSSFKFLTFECVTYNKGNRFTLTICWESHEGKKQSVFLYQVPVAWYSITYQVFLNSSTVLGALYILCTLYINIENQLVHMSYV